MNRAQKIAWLMIVVIGICGIAFAVLSLAGLSTALRLLVVGSIVGLSGLMVPILSPKSSSLVKFDERDWAIELKATRISFILSYVLFVLLCLTLWVYYRHQGSEMISIDILPIMIWPPAIFLFFIYAVMILILYGKDKYTAEGESI